MTYTEAEINHIAVELCQNDNEGHFLRAMGEAWQVADVSNKPLLKPLMEQLIKKYELEKLFNYEYGIDRGERRVEANL